jgi:hypothetical protein
LSGGRAATSSMDLGFSACAGEFVAGVSSCLADHIFLNSDMAASNDQ